MFQSTTLGQFQESCSHEKINIVLVVYGCEGSLTLINSHKELFYMELYFYEYTELYFISFNEQRSFNLFQNSSIVIKKNLLRYFTCFTHKSMNLIHLRSEKFRFRQSTIPKYFVPMIWSIARNLNVGEKFRLMNSKD